MLIKKYQIGKVTPKLLSSKENFNDQLILSCGKGSGMKLLSLSQGEIIMVAGGTGIFPFIDFLDILFKKALIL